MKIGKLLVGLSLGAALIVPGVASAQDKKDDKKPAPKKEEAKKVRCPLSKEEIKDPSKAPNSEYKGKKILFCCAECKAKFDKDPEKFAPKDEKKDRDKKADKKDGDKKDEKKDRDKKGDKK